MIVHRPTNKDIPVVILSGVIDGNTCKAVTEPPPIKVGSQSILCIRFGFSCIN